MEDTQNTENGIPPVASGTAHTPTGSTLVAPIPATAPRSTQAPQVKDPSPEDIGAAMSKETATAPTAPNAPTSETPVTFDLSQLRPEQLQQLKAMLSATPERSQQERGNPIVTIRRLVTYTTDGQEQQRLITHFKNAYNTWVHDELANINKEIVLIPVHFLGDEEGKYTNVNYKDFISADSIRCEVISTRTKPGRIIEGEVVSRETGRLVQREIKTLETWFTIKLPEGTTPSTVEIESKIANG